MSTTKRITKRLLAVVLTVLMLMSMVTIGITSASAASVELATTGANVSSGTVIYFDNSTFGWTNKVIQLMIGHSSWSQGYQMTNLNGTDLYYVSMPSWDGATQLCVFGADSVWGGEGSSISNRKNWAPNSTPIYSLSSNISGTHLLTTTSSALSKTTLSAYSALNTTQTISALVNGEAATDAATFTASSYNLTGKTASAASSGTTTVSAARTADVTMTAAANEGYTFLGWSTDGTSVTSADATYTYTCDGTAKTVYALFETAAEESSSSTGEVESQPTTTEPTVTDPAETNGTAFELDWAESNGLYAYAGATDEAIDAEAWQRWLSKSEGRVFYLPASASKTEVIIYNSYANTVTVNGVKIDAGCYNTVPYVAGTAYTVADAENQTLVVYNTDAEASLFINTDKAKGSVVNDDDAETETKLSNLSGIWYDYIVAASKNREAKKLGGAVASADGIVVEQVKKIKGRGNTTWEETKKPFNITFADAIGIDGMDSAAKWSLLANAKDDSLMRNRIVYDMANEVGMKYACDSRFVDFYVDGRYMGSYQLVQKIEMGEGTVMGDLIEPEVEDVIDDETGETISYPKENFDFVLELDTQKNADNAGDLTFTTSRGQVMTHKIPDKPADEQVAFMKAKYQAVEDALYGDDLATLETLVDMNDMAKAYLINEISKNVDAGITSCYFVYNADDAKFYLSPVWDYDNALGNMGDTTRKDLDGNYLDLGSPSDWYASELAHYDANFTGKNSVFSMACHTTSKTADGKAFADYVAEVWESDFADLIDILEGTIDGEGRLKSIDDYKALLAKSGQWNYENNRINGGWTLKQNWTSDHSSLTMYDLDAETNSVTAETKTYNANNAQDMNQYAGDWAVSRLNWISAQYAGAEVPAPKMITIYFENNWKWPDAKIYIWGSSITSANNSWPGVALTKVVGQNDAGYDIYEIQIPEDATGIIFNGTGEYGAEQSADIKGGWYEGICYYMTYDSATNTKPCGTYDYKVPEETTSAPAETTTAPAESSSVATTDETDPVETTTTAPAETTTAPDDGVGYVTVYFQNNWLWSDVSIYIWNSSITEANNAWPGVAMELYGNDGTYDVYSAVIPEDCEFIINGIKDDGSGATDQTPDLANPVDGTCYYMKWDNGNQVGSEDITVIIPPEETTSAPAEETDPTEATTDATEGTTASNPASGDQDATEATTASVPDMPTVITVYAINSAKWDEVYAYCWATDPAVAWPGVAMDKTEDTVNGFDVYALSFDSAYVNVIFNNNNNGSQTADLTAMDGQYYDIKGGNWYASLEEVPGLDTLSTDRYLVGEFNSWSTTANEFKLKAEGESYGYVTLTLDANTTYEFKIVREGTWTSCTTPITATVEGLTFSSSNSDNCTITTTEAGEYVFAFGINNSQLSVTYPGSEVITPTTPDEEETDTTVKLAGDFTEWGTNAIEMTADENGTVYTTELYLEANTYEFKMIEFGKWLGNNGSIENTCEGWTFRNGTDENGNEYGNCTLVATGGTYTFTFDTATDKLTVTAVLDPIVTPVCDIVFLNEGNHYTHDAPATVDEGSSFQFTITPEENYKVVAVIADMMELAPDENGVYTCEDVSNCVQIMVFLTEETSDDTPIIPANTWTVMFVDDNNNIIAIEKVTDGESVAAPEAPEKAGYTFTGWSADTSNVTEDMIVVAQYKKNAVEVEPATTGSLKVEVAGGTGFAISIDGGAARPQGTSYYNSVAPIGVLVTVTANSTSDNEFIGWINPANGRILSTELTYSFNTSGNDFIKAMYNTKVEGVQMVIFFNDKLEQQIDVQYYASTDSINVDLTTAFPGYDFMGWNMTAEEIQAAIANGEDVTVLPEWQRQLVYVAIDVTGGYVSGNGGMKDGKYLANAKTTVTANAPEAGMKFAYWTLNGKIVSYDTTYSFYPKTDAALEAVFVGENDAIDYVILTDITNFDQTAYNNLYASFTTSWYVPEEGLDVDFVDAGLVAINKDYYKEGQLYVGSGLENMQTKLSTSKDAIGEYTWIGQVTSGQTWVVRSFVRYTDADGSTQTMYSDEYEFTKTN